MIKEYRDIFGWFPETTADALRGLIKEHDVSTVIEIGSFLGKSTAFFAENVVQTIAIDPFVAWPEGNDNDDARAAGEDFYEQFKANILEIRSHGARLADIQVVRKTSVDAYESNPDLEADLVYIDAVHDYKSVFIDCRMWLGRARKIICGDDYDENWPGVMEAVDELFRSEVHLVGNFWYVIL
jgi:cephalosporin hydroxylase